MTSSRDEPWVRIGLLGCGRAGHTLHLPAIGRVTGCKLTAVAEPNASMLAAATKSHPDIVAFDDWREALRRDAFDAVVIGLPSFLHAEAATAAIDAGKHVYVEKPIAIDPRQCCELLMAQTRAADELAQPGGGRLVAMSGFNFRFHPVFERMRQRLIRGDVGDIAAISTVFAVPPRQLPPWKVDRQSGGGAMLDQLSHHADLLRFLLGDVTATRPRRVLAQTRSLRSRHDTATVMTQMTDDVLVTTTCTLCSSEQDRIEVHGTRGKLVADRVAGQVWFEVAGGGYNRIDRTDRLAAGALRAAKLSGFLINPLGQTGHVASIQEFVNAIRERREPSISLRDGALALQWVLAAERSVETGAWADFDPGEVGIPLPEVDPPVASQSVSDADGTRDADSPVPPHASRMPPLVFSDDRPLATVVLVASKVDGSVINVARHLRRQTVAKRLEFIVVAPSESQAQQIVQPGEGETESLGQVRTIALGRPVHDVDAEAASGVQIASAPVTCIIEDHAFPAPDWVERLTDAYRSGEKVGAAGSCVLNANPRSGISRMNLLIAYGPFMEPLDIQSGTPSNHNVSYRTDAVAVYGQSLTSKLSRTGTIMDDLYRRGFATKIVPEAKVQHANPSTWRSSMRLRFDAGRLLASQRADLECWSAIKRWAYCMLSPGIAPVRFARFKEKREHHRYGPLATAALAGGLICDALGQGIGFVRGNGGAADRCREFELGRLRHLRTADQKMLSDPKLRFDWTTSNRLTPNQHTSNLPAPASAPSA